MISNKINLKLILTCFLVLIFSCVKAQDMEQGIPSSLISSNYQLDHTTGLPGVNIPIYSMPTRTKGLNLNVSLSYHPSSISVFNSKMGDMGRGWSLLKGGVIHRNLRGNPIELYWSEGLLSSSESTYDFSFLGFTGKFIVEKNFQGELEVNYESNEQGKIFKVDIDYDPITYIINSFTIYDSQGLQYIFDICDQGYVQWYTPTTSGNVPKVLLTKHSYHLSTIKDPNNISIVSFNYDVRNYLFTSNIPAGGSQDDNKVHTLKQITSDGFGSIIFNKNILLHPKEVSCSVIQIKDINNYLIREFIFEYELFTSDLPKFEGDSNYYLTKIIEKHDQETKEHTLYYSLDFIYSVPENSTVAIDQWGYLNTSPKIRSRHSLGGLYNYLQALDYLPSEYAQKNILKRIRTPEGGSIVYNYELNDYSFWYGKPLDVDINDQIISDFYYDLDASTSSSSKIRPNIQNYNQNIYHQSDFSTEITEFTLSENKKLYFQFDVIPYVHFDPNITDSHGNPQEVTIYPTFTLKRNNININTQGFFTSDKGYGSSENGGLGKSYDLTPGNYTITTPGTGLGSLKIIELSPKTSTIKKWYGGGMRIRSIKYYDNYSPFPNTPVPVRQIDFNYNLFEDPSKSSGNCVDFGFNLNSYYNPYSSNYNIIDLPIYLKENRNAITYSNITVTDSGSEGKTRYKYTSAIDESPPPIYRYDHDFRFGKIKEISVLDNQNNIKTKTIFDYETSTYYITPGMGNPATGYSSRLGWITPSEKTTIKYQDNSSLSEAEYYHYSGRPILLSKTNSTSLNAVNEEKKYFYHYLNSIYSKNRQELDRIERYINNSLVHTTKVVYSNIWTALAEDSGATNVAYLPLLTESSKNGVDYKVVSKVNLYDQYSNIIEHENEQGTVIVNIWGYNKTKVVAKIENATYAQIPQSLITAIQTASNTSNETALLNELDNLRNHSSLAQALISTYTYKPLIGISTETDYRGRRMSYHYDDFGRLKEVRDHNNNILTDTEYYYEPQN